VHGCTECIDLPTVLRVTETPDRRSAVKARSRHAILEAADALIVERGAPAFSVDELAERADVSRRTVFNHFGSLDDVVLTVCAQRLGQVIAEVELAATRTPVGDGSRASMFDELAETLRGADLPAPITYLANALGPLAQGDDPRAAALAQQAFARVADHLVDELLRRYPHADPLDVRLLVTSLVHGVGVIAMHWCTTTDPAAPDARAAWDGLVDRLIENVRAGYMPEH